MHATRLVLRMCRFFSRVLVRSQANEEETLRSEKRQWNKEIETKVREEWIGIGFTRISVSSLTVQN